MTCCLHLIMLMFLVFTRSCCAVLRVRSTSFFTFSIPIHAILYVVLLFSGACWERTSIRFSTSLLVFRRLFFVCFSLSHVILCQPQTASSSSATSSVANPGSPKPEKRQANSPLPPPPENPMDMYAIIDKRNKGTFVLFFFLPFSRFQRVGGGLFALQSEVKTADEALIDL